jgi:uncharacterized membrane protein YkvA (DUF1232 family)
MNPSLLHKLRVEVHAAWLAARDPRTAWYARLFGLGLTAYALSPIDLVPDFIPILGLVDDALLIPVGLWLFLKMLPDGLFEECKAKAEEAADRPRSSLGAVLVVLAWIGIALIALSLLAWNYS